MLLPSRRRVARGNSICASLKVQIHPSNLSKHTRLDKWTKAVPFWPKNHLLTTVQLVKLHPIRALMAVPKTWQVSFATSSSQHLSSPPILRVISIIIRVSTMRMTKRKGEISKTP
jgi:hypothetical protein